MAICYIPQEEVYASSRYDDRLNLLDAESATSLLEDLNYIRSTIFAIYGVDYGDINNKWYKVPFYNLTFLYQKYLSLYEDFSVEHYTKEESQALAGKHKNVTATGNLSVAGQGSIGQSLTVGSFLNVGTTLTVGSDATINGNLRVRLDTTLERNLSVLLDANIGRNLTVGGDVSVADDLSVGGDLSVVGDGTIKNLSVNEVLTVGLGAHIFTGLNVYGPASISGNTSVGSNLSVAQKTTTQTLEVTGLSYVRFGGTTVVVNNS